MMTRRIWVTIASGGLAVALFVVLLGGTALAQEDDETGTSMAQAFVERLATKLGMTSDELTNVVKETQLEVVDEAVASGELTEQQGEALRERLESEDGLSGFGFGRGHGFGHARGGFAACFSIETIATTLGMTTDELRAEIESGATLSEIITAQGQTVDSVVDALVAEAKVQLDEAVAAGRITQDQADEKLAELPERLTTMIEEGRIGPGGPWRHMRGGETN